MKTAITYTVGSETLQEILITSLKTTCVYEHLLKYTKNPYIEQWLSSKINSTANFILDVQVELEAMGIQPRELSKFQMGVHHLTFELKLLGTRVTDEIIIRESLTADNSYLNSLTEVRKSAVVTDKLYQLYSNQIEAIRQKSSKQVKKQNVLLG